ncbi:MAG: AMP-binding protein [Spirochaetales bacterium]|nr:AMP-binding protein [Spirochaetales bacterium]
MLIVNRDHHTDRDFDQRMNGFFHIEALRNVEGKLVGVCCGKPLDFLGLIFYVLNSRGAILIIHPETPFENAKEICRKSGCAFLVYHDCGNIHALDGTFQYHEPSILYYSSGTTGEPKLIERTWNNIQRETDEYNRKAYFDAGETPVVLTPLTHSYGLGSGVLAAMKRGSTPVVVTERNPKFMAHLIKKTSKGIVYGTPFFFSLLISMRDPELRFHKVVSSGAPLTEKLLGRLRQCSHAVYQQYGSTETGCIALGQDPASATDVGSPLDHLAVSIDDGNSPGEIKVSFDEKTVHTRDLGYFSDAGSLNVVSRMDDVINVGGQKVVPYEVETIISRMDNVKEVVVYKSKHPVYGETVKAMVVPHDGVSAVMIKEWCQKHLPPFKIPSAVKIVDEIPKTSGGKISRKLLSEEECE